MFTLYITTFFLNLPPSIDKMDFTTLSECLRIKEQIVEQFETQKDLSTSGYSVRCERM